MPESMAPRKKKVDVSQSWLSRYHDPRAPGSLGGVQRFAKAHHLPLKKVQRVLERDLAYTLHKPRRRRFPTVPVIVARWSVAKQNAPVCAGAESPAVITIVECCTNKYGGRS